MKKAKKKNKGFDREEMRRQLKERQKAGNERKSGSGFKSFLMIPEDVSIFKPDVGDHEIDILPYVAGKYDPLVDEGSYTHCLDILVHMAVGSANDQFICPDQYGNKCPICEKRNKLYAVGEEERANQLWPSRRTVYNILCYDNKKEEEKGVQVYPVSYFYLEKEIQKLAAKSKRKNDKSIDPNILIADPKDGRTVSFTVDKKTININKKAIKVPDYSSYELQKRDYEIDESDLESCFCLDDFLYLGQAKQDSGEIDWKEFYKEIKESFDDAEEDDEQDKKSKKRKKKSRDEEEPEDEDEGEEDSDDEEDDDDEEGQIDRDSCPGEFGVDTGDYDECEDCIDFIKCAATKKKTKSKKILKKKGRK